MRTVAKVFRVQFWWVRGLAGVKREKVKLSDLNIYVKAVLTDHVF